MTHKFDLRVYYEDTDAGGVVFYANYLKFFERARTEWLREMGFEATSMATELGGLFVVRAVDVEYLSPARLDDPLRIETTVATLGGSRVEFFQKALCADRELVLGKVTCVWVRYEDFRAARIPDSLRHELSKLGY